MSLLAPMNVQDPIASNYELNKHKKLSFAQLSIMIFTLTCAGPFGIEAAIQSGGVFYTLIGLIILPFVYSIPQSLMTAELGSMMPSHHGYIIWVFRGFENDRFGHFLGFYNALGCLAGMAKDIPIYIIYLVFYFKKLAFNDFNWSFTWIQQYSLMILLIIIGAVFNIANITTLGNSQIVFASIILLPFVIGFFYSLPDTNVYSWTNTTPQSDNGQYQWGLFLSTMLWLHTGWDSTGCLTAEFRFDKSKFFNAFIIGMVLDYLTYTIAVLGAVTVPCNASDSCWDLGYLYTAYDAILPGLGLVVAISGFFSSFSLYIAEMSVQARALWSVSQPFCLLAEDGTMFIETEDGILYDRNMEIVDPDDIEYDVETTRRINIGILPKWLCGTIWKRTGAPVRGVILQSLLCCVLVSFDFEFLLEASVLLNCITWCTEMVSFLRLRYTEPDTERPYKVPGGLCVAWFITIVKCVLVLVLFVLVINDHVYYIAITIGFFVLVVIWYWLHMKYRYTGDNHHYQRIDS
eukprot:465305_1